MTSLNGTIFLFLLLSVSRLVSTEMEDEMRAVEGQYSEPIKGCIWGHTLSNGKYRNIVGLDECKSKCSSNPSCKSLEYHRSWEICWISGETQATQRLLKPCSGGYADLVYLEKLSSQVIADKKAYLGLKNDGSEHFKSSVKKLLPKLLNADALSESQVGVAYDVTHPKRGFNPYEKYPLALLTGSDITTTKVKLQSVTINGTVNKAIGKRSYHDAIFRPSGLYAKPGDIITITIPEQLVGKLKAKIGQDSKYWIIFPLKKSTQKIASPFGGLIIIYLDDIDATSKYGVFNVQIENAIQAPYFVYGKDTNAEWNNVIKKNAAPWTVLRIPGQVHIYIKTQAVKTETDIEGILKKWKRTFDAYDEFLSIPLNLQPGEEQLHFNPFVGGGLRHDVCQGGGKSQIGGRNAYYTDFSKGGFGTLYHELGHGYCYDDLPNAGGQWWADFVAAYMNNKLDGDKPSGNNWNLELLYKMVSFSKFSNGKACGVAKFDDGSDDWLNERSYKNSYSIFSYYNCWTDLYYLPIWEFGWDILGKVMKSDGLSSKAYNSKTDRLAELYCKATGKNLIPLFNFYNIKVSSSIAAPCENHQMPDMITKFINIANCIKNENINHCTELPGFPPHKGICSLNGICNKSPDYNHQTIRINNELDIWGLTTNKELKKGNRNTGEVKENCLARAEETWLWCKNDLNQPITATYASNTGESNSLTIPNTEPSQPFDSGSCYNVKPLYSVLPKLLGKDDGSDLLWGGFSNMTTDFCTKKCAAKSFIYAGTTSKNYCSCGMSPPFASRKVSKKECNSPCSGDKSKKCGGSWRMSIFKIK